MTRIIELESHDDYIRDAAKQTDADIRDTRNTIARGVERLTAAGFEVDSITFDDWAVATHNHVIGSNSYTRSRNVRIVATRTSDDRMCVVTVRQGQAKPGRVWCDGHATVERREWIDQIAPDDGYDEIATENERYIHVANGGRIPASALLRAARGQGREDIADRLLDICSGRYLRYSGEDDDVLSSCWSALGWPRDGEIDRA